MRRAPWIVLLATLASLVVEPATGEPDDAPRRPVDTYGDPLPEGAIARLGTARWRHGFQQVHAIAVSPNGKWVATSGTSYARMSVVVWEASTGKKLHEMTHRGRAIMHLAFTGDSKELLVVDDGLRRLELPEMREAPTKPEVGTTFRIEPSPAGRTLLRIGAKVDLAIVGSKDEPRAIDPNLKTAYRATFRSDGKLVAIALADRTIRLIEVATAKERARCEGVEDVVAALRFAPDGRKLLAATRNGSLQTWSQEGGKPAERQALTLGRKSTTIQVIADFSDDGQTLAYALPSSPYQDDRGVRVWDVAAKKVRFHFEAKTDVFHGLRHAPDGTTLYGGAEFGRVRRWDLNSGDESCLPIDASERFLSIAFGTDDRTIVATAGRTWFQFDLATNKESRRVRPTPVPLASRAMSHDFSTVALGKAGNRTSIFDIWNDREISAVEGIAWVFTPDSKALVVSKSDHTKVRLVDVATGKDLRELKEIPISFSPDGACFISRRPPALVGPVGVHPDRTAIVDTATGKERATLDFIPHGAAFSLDSRRLALVGNEHFVLVDVETAAIRQQFQRPPRSPLLLSVRVSPDGKLVATVDREGWVSLWETATGRLRRAWQAHDSHEVRLAFSHSGKFLATTGQLGDILVWRVHH